MFLDVIDAIRIEDKSGLTTSKKSILIFSTYLSRIMRKVTVGIFITL